MPPCGKCGAELERDSRHNDWVCFPCWRQRLAAAKGPKGEPGPVGEDAALKAEGAPTGEKVYWVNARCPESKEIDAILGTGEKGEPGPEGKPSPPVCEVCKRAATEIFWPDGDRCHHFCKSHYEVAARIARLKALIQSESDVILTDNGYFSVTGSNDVGVNTATGGLVRWESITAVFKRAKETK